ncbi:MAG: DUF4396 domain-containing protein [Actinomycetota bacterium]|nr:DUF4396 domain-containing protein [Actinomycetota bacterium]
MAARYDLDEPPERPRWASVATGVSHCGSGCSLGDLIAERVVFGIGATLAGLALFPEYIADYGHAVKNPTIMPICIKNQYAA